MRLYHQEFDCRPLACQVGLGWPRQVLVEHDFAMRVAWMVKEVMMHARLFVRRANDVQTVLL